MRTPAFSEAQVYFTAADWVLAGNRFARANGMHHLARVNAPNWYFEYLGNEIRAGSGHHKCINRVPRAAAKTGV